MARNRGFDKAIKDLKQLEKNLGDLSKEKSVSFDKLFTTSFMSKYTHAKSFEDFLVLGGFKVESQQDFENIPDSEFDQHVIKHSRFSSWQEMLETAGQEYIAKQFGL